MNCAASYARTSRRRFRGAAGARHPYPYSRAHRQRRKQRRRARRSRSRYGDLIFLKPPFKPETLLLWLSPVLTLGLGVAAALYARRRGPQHDTPVKRGRGSAARGADRRRREQWMTFMRRASVASARGSSRGLGPCAGDCGPRASRRHAAAKSWRKSDFRRARPVGFIAARRPCLSASSRAGRPFRLK